MIKYKKSGKSGEKTDFDIIVVGGGSAGFSAAIRGAEMGKKVALIENRTIGGTCVNIGCVPSKFIISEAFSGTSWNKIKEGRDNLVRNLRNEKYIKVLESYSDNVTYIHETATFTDNNSVILSSGKTVTADLYIITTGSKPSFPDITGIQEIDPLDSTGLLFIENLPESLIIVGGRFIALELGHVFAKLGVRVTILQRSKKLIPDYNTNISDEVEKLFRDQDIEVITGTKLLKASPKGSLKTLTYSKEGKEKEISADRIVFATGRTGNTDSLNPGAAGIKLDDSGHIITDKYLRTSNPKIFAAGDVLASPGLVYVAAKEGQTAVTNAFSELPLPLKYDSVPEVIFTHPQIARAGIREQDAVTRGIPVSISKFFISDTPYGLANNDKKGVIILIKNRDSGELIGGEIFAKDAGNMIQTITIAIKAHMTIEDIVGTYFPYLTAVEGIKLGAVVFNKDVKMLSCCAG